MPTQLMNEAERFLLEHWTDARLLEESMERVRTKYKEVFQRIIAAVTEAHPELDASVVFPTQFWGPGYIGFGRKSWPLDGEVPSGLWMKGLRLDLLAAEDSEPPKAYLRHIHKSKVSLNLDIARRTLSAAAKDLLTPEQLKDVEAPESDDVLLRLPAPSKAELRSALFTNDGFGFVERIVSQFDLMARFVPVLDAVFLAKTD